jgi:hypothetical protein
MDSEKSVSNLSKDDLRKRIAETRQALGNKVEDLEGSMQHLSGTVRGAVHDVKQQFDMRYQISQRPLAWIGVSFIGGVLLGAISGRRAHKLREIGGFGRPGWRSVAFERSENPTVRESGSFVQSLFRRALADAVPMLVQAGGAYLLGAKERRR